MQPLVRLPFLLALADRASIGADQVKDEQSKIEQVVVTAEQSLAMQQDEAISVVMATPIPWSDSREVMVAFWRKSAPPSWVKAA